MHQGASQKMATQMSPMVVFGGQDLEWFFLFYPCFLCIIWEETRARKTNNTRLSPWRETKPKTTSTQSSVPCKTRSSIDRSRKFSTRAFLQDRRTVKLSAWHNPPTMLTSWKPVFLPKIHANFVLYFTIYCWSIKMSLVVYHEAKLRV